MKICVFLLKDHKNILVVTRYGLMGDGKKRKRKDFLCNNGGVADLLVHWLMEGAD